MDHDLRRLREFGETLKPHDSEPPADLRRRVLLSVKDAAPARKSLRRWRIATLTAGAVAACAVLMSFPGSVGPQPYPLEHMLKTAAYRVAAAPDFSPRADQFVYTESIAVYREVRAVGAAIRQRQVRLRAWRSVDGRHEGLVQTLPIDAWATEWDSQAIPACQPDSCQAAVSAAGLPTDADAMYHYLYRAEPANPSFQQLGVDERALSRAAEVLRLSQHLPEVQSAVFQAMARIPGVSLRLDAVDVAGRHGIALAYTGKGNETELVFEPGTYRYLGVNRKMTWIYVVREPDRLVLLPDEAIREAVTRVAIVDRVGQR